MRGLIAIGVGIGVVAVLAVVAVTLTARQGPATFPPDSPQAAFQGYLEAFEDGDYEAAYGFFSTQVQAQMGFDEYERVAREFGQYATETRRVLYDGLDQVETDGEERATLRMTVEVSYGGLFVTDRYSYPTEVPLVREDGAWRIDQPLIHVDPAPVNFDPAPAPVD